MNLVDAFHVVCQLHPQKIALQSENTSLTYSEFHLNIHGLAEDLLAYGLNPGDTVGLWMENSIEFIVSYFAIQHIGCVVVPLDPLSVPREVSFVLENAKSHLLLTTPRFHEVALALSVGKQNLKVHTLLRKLRPGKPNEPATLTADRNTLACIIYTSGTTGHPKGAMLTHGNLLANAQAVRQVMNINHDTRMICILPLFHCFAAMVNMLSPLLIGGRVIPIKQFRPDTALKAIESYKITHLTGVPSMYLVMGRVDNPESYDLSSLLYLVSGGAGLPPKVAQVFQEKFKKEIHEGYGLSEASPVVSFNSVDHPNVPGSIGTPIPGVRVKIVDDQFNSLSLGEIGELAVKGPNVMIGYLGLPDATREALRDGWLLTGDMAKMDESGNIYIVDRKKEMILVRGHNVYPREVENILYQHPAVLEAAVVPHKDERSGEVVRAVISVKEGYKITTHEIRDFCKGKLTSYKIPKIIDIIPALPKTNTGKIKKRALIDPVSV